MFASEPLQDSEDKIIERLGDCDVAVDYMDLLSHRIRCRKIEIFHYDDEVSFTPNDEEEEQEMSYGPMFSEDHTDDEDRTLQLVKDLDCLIRRIEQMQIVIKERKKQQDLESGVTEASTEQLKKQTEKPVEKQKDEQKKLKVSANDELSCVELMEVRDLQHGHHRLQCEINEMICNYRLLRELLKKLRAQMCQENRRCRQLGAQIVQFKEWSEEVAKELPVCKERYQRLLDKKLTKEEAARVIKANIAKAYRRSKSFLCTRQLRFDLREFHAEIDELTEYADDLCQEMMRRFTSIENDSALTHSLVESNSSQLKSLEKEDMS
ncbi:uncharacterized protein LOC117784901 [Drosophila innubila]|uniref:uncharacterized protein LOC117784901 n=1 Tax=Drosophila innubila TaxID=198719 RepID=UPI00148DC7C3|nr:uncharacterized protein LOC117784901 [Drosophila innubila]